MPRPSQQRHTLPVRLVFGAELGAQELLLRDSAELAFLVGGYPLVVFRVEDEILEELDWTDSPELK